MDFWDIRERERAEEASLRKAIDILDATINFAKRAQAIRTAAGYNDFVASIRQLHVSAMSKLATDATLNNDALRELRGRVSALADLLSLVTSERATDLLEARKLQVQNDLDDALKRRPKPREVTT